jgi:hypothetical protein
MKRRRLCFSGLLIAGLIVGWIASTRELSGQINPEPQANSAPQQEMPKPNLRIFRTYTLKYIKPEELLKATRILLEDASYSDNMITINIWQSRIPSFEEMLGKLDVEKKVIQFQAFAIIASREANLKPSEAIDNKDLKRVLDEIKVLWSFKSYEADGPSYISVRESSGPNSFGLVTSFPLSLTISDAKVAGEGPGKRTITIGQLKLARKANPGETGDYEYLDTHDVVLKEGGYIVAGVSGLGSTSKALILVVSAEIK